MSLRPWILGFALPLLVSLGMAFTLELRQVFLPGTTSDGHHLMEASCLSCHSPFEGVSNDRCTGCHQAELTADIHPPALFDDPRWAADREKIEVSSCITCHSEHKVAAGGVTIRRDFCFDCHRDVMERASHRGLAPMTCGDAGCHNYHDGSTLQRDFLAAHQCEPDLLEGYGVPARTPAAGSTPSLDEAAAPPTGLAAPDDVIAAWRRSAHASADVGCSSCHERDGRLVRNPGREVCRDCHAFAADTFLAGKHGMRIRVGLPGLRPRDARLPMKPQAIAGSRHLDCATCHDPHDADTRRAATEACLGCHDDLHTRSFAGSPHSERDVTCATCHLPRMELSEDGRRRVVVNHNNSLTLSPPDRMAATVCHACHGLELSLTALLDESLIDNNFSGPPRGGLKTFSMLQPPAMGSGKGASE